MVCVVAELAVGERRFLIQNGNPASASLDPGCALNHCPFGERFAGFFA
jgi:hypothetical protein